MDKIDIEKDGQNEHFLRGVCFPNIGIFSKIGIYKNSPLRRPCIELLLIMQISVNLLFYKAKRPF